MKIKFILMALLLSMVSLFAENIDLEKSSFIWRGSKITGDFHSGPIKMQSAFLEDGKGEFVADMNSIEDVTLKGEWKKKFLKHMKSDYFFYVEKFNTSKLEIEKMDNGYLYGKLTIKDQTHAISIPFEKKDNVYSGQFGFDRTQYDMIYGSGNFFKNLGDKVISDTVTLQFTVVTN